MAKRSMDLLLSLLGLLVLAPLLLLIACWIKLDSRGPVFFRQERVGRFGVPFRIHKFRTMKDGASIDGPSITVGADARITRAGRWLRQSKLDELPQLIDVVQGRMSMVGPRPEVPRYVALYPAELRAKVLSVRPGITGLAQALYRSNCTQEQRVEADLRYTREANVWLDLKIMLMTVKRLSGKGGN